MATPEAQGLPPKVVWAVEGEPKAAVVPEPLQVPFKQVAVLPIPMQMSRIIKRPSKPLVVEAMEVATQQLHLMAQAEVAEVIMVADRVPLAAMLAVQFGLKLPVGEVVPTLSMQLQPVWQIVRARGRPLEIQLNLVTQRGLVAAAQVLRAVMVELLFRGDFCLSKIFTHGHEWIVFDLQSQQKHIRAYGI